MKIDLTKITYGFFGACAVAGLTYLGIAKYYEKEIAFGEEYSTVISAVNNIDESYYKGPDKSYYAQNMIGGLVNGLNDRYSNCTDHNMGVENDVNYSAQLQAAGFRITFDSVSENIMISEVKHNSQAEKMGLCRGDLILSIDGESVIKEGYYNIIPKLIGKSGTSVELLVDHDGEKKNITYVREKDFENSRAINSNLYDNGVFYFRLNSFNIQATDDFSREFDSVIAENNVTDLVIDIRNNHGGEIEEAVKFFDLFAPAGNVVATEETKGGKIETFTTTNDIKYKNLNIVILVSENTCSSGEILTALFQDTGFGTVIGTQTAGKGVFQNTYSFDKFSSYALVAGYYYVNDVPNYDGVGIIPDIEIQMDSELIGTDDDIQLKKALELLS
ncbi:S41 family peptidase [Ruminococcus sp.]|uniref:S41 family peptidase n=1 Tax=Ruminococcus sp. TaxID=41978 RepID=UPI0025E28082|nr:S41 family peptidase [Ruminococcus sp.]MCR4638444.1 PDZ domain-containing protein [Ruminococcus sp.]